MSPPIPGHGMGRETTDSERKGSVGEGNVEGGGISFIGRNPASFPALPLIPKKNRINHSHTTPGARVALSF